jgi:hypothetical protein
MYEIHCLTAKYLALTLNFKRRAKFAWNLLLNYRECFIFLKEKRSQKKEDDDNSVIKVVKSYRRTERHMNTEL